MVESAPLSHWREARVAERRQWTNELFTLKIDAPEIAFSAGQFASIALPTLPEDRATETMTARPYSFLNAPNTAPHEFLITTVAEGKLTPRLAQLNAGDPIWIGPSYGFFGCNDLPSARNLWMLATGTGIAPFLSILRTEQPWQKFERIIFVHGVRYQQELVYRDVIDGIKKQYKDRFLHLSSVTREKVADDGALVCFERITTALENGRLEKQVGEIISAENSQVMLCGNPAMIDEVQSLLKVRDMRRHRLRKPGQITVESYW
jgi:Flavodoxin reductases (ferredoxin-NADPH reductases) family 1